MKNLKKIIPKMLYTQAIILIIVSLAFSPVFAAPGYDPGIKGEETTRRNEFKYTEVIFLTGEPIVMEGTMEVSESSTGSKTTLTYKMANTAKNAKLDRKVVFNNTSKANNLGNQVTYASSLDPKFTEVIQLGTDRYTLSEYKFSRSGLKDQKAAIEYQVSDWNGRKVYNRNNNMGQIVVDIESHLDSYQNFWSATETSIITNTITYRYKNDTKDINYQETYGQVDYAVSNSNMKALSYITNNPRDIGFRGGYILKESQENVVSYSYDIPKMNTDWKPDGIKRSKGKDSYKLSTMPIQTRLFVPTIKDVSPSYWAAEDIKKLVSMDIISNIDTNYFRPLGFISRGEFTKSIVKASYNPDQLKAKTYEVLFDDVEKNHPYFTFINTAVKSGIINGTGNKKFNPDDYLTKAQAVAIIIRAMGLEESANVSSLQTSFDDDYMIPGWAKKSVNVAKQMGIVNGNEYNEFEPGKVLTRAECAALINRFIKYLQYDIKYEYREKVINFGK